MKRSENLKSHILISILLVAFSSACTLNNMGKQKGSITKGDLQTASRILGESLSSNNSGVLLSLNDALTNISSSEFIPSTASKSTISPPSIQSGHSGRGNETNYQHSYNPETGIHTVSFQRQVKRSLFEKSVTDNLQYIFRDKSGGFIRSPRQNSDHIESITYNGRREGEITTLKKESFFVRQDTFLIDGMSEASPALTIDGVHNGKGIIKIERPNKSALERSYALEINFLNIEIKKTASGEINMSRGVTGSLSWEMTIERGSNSKTLRGTIELSADGTALLHFENFLKLFQVNMDNGDVKDLDHEFEGGVESVNINAESVTLVNGQTIYLNNDTEFDDDAYPTLRSVREALDSGLTIWTEGEGGMQNGRFIVTEVEFENADEEGSSDDIEEVKFEEQVTAVDLQTGTFTLNNQVIVETNDQTTFENSSDYQSLQEVSYALDQGITVIADGDGKQASKSSGADLVAHSVDFDQEDSNGEGD